MLGIVTAVVIAKVIVTFSMTFNEVFNKNQFLIKTTFQTKFSSHNVREIKYSVKQDT